MTEDLETIEHPAALPTLAADVPAITADPRVQPGSPATSALNRPMITLSIMPGDAAVQDQVDLHSPRRSGL